MKITPFVLLAFPALAFAAAPNRLECDLSRVTLGDAPGLKGSPLVAKSTEFESSFDLKGSGIAGSFEVSGTISGDLATLVVQAKDPDNGKEIRESYTLQSGYLLQTDINDAKDQSYGNATLRVTCGLNLKPLPAASPGCPVIKGTWACGSPKINSTFVWDQQIVSDGISTQYNSVMAPFGTRFQASPTRRSDPDGSYVQCVSETQLELYGAPDADGSWVRNTYTRGPGDTLALRSIGDSVSVDGRTHQKYVSHFDSLAQCVLVETGYDMFAKH